ncbi:MAG TPA: HDOD domain-containing protein [Burkholderiales bacterium]|nr:HDOD domain-containing protein [Burkholderiales bacterium]
MKPLRAADQGGTIDLPFNEHVLARLLAALDDRTASNQALADLLLCDPALALHVLASAGPLPAAAEAAQSISVQACVGALGRDMLRALGLLQLGKQLGNGTLPYPRSVLARIWGRSVLCAELAGRLARALNQPGEPAQLAGLLHQIGKLVLLRSRGEAYARMLTSLRKDADLVRAEREALDTTHAALGAAWLEASGLPGFVADALRFLHEPAERLGDAPCVVRAVAVGSALVEDGVTELTARVAAQLTGLAAPAITRLFEEATAAARANPAGVEIAESASGQPAELERGLLGGDLSLQASANPAPRPAATVRELVASVAHAGLHEVMREALSGAENQSAALARIRRLARLLTGIRRQFFFLAAVHDQRLIGVATPEDPASLAKLAVSLEGSPSMLAQAVRERCPARAMGPDLERSAAIDRVLARMMASGGLLCLPMTDTTVVLGVLVVGLPADWREPSDDEALLARVAALGGETLARIGRDTAHAERIRSELTERFRALGRRVVHEAGNPLSIVKNYLKLLKDKIGDTGQFGEELTVLNEELDRVGRIVHRMGDPFSVASEEPARLDLNNAVQELMLLCRDTLFSKRGIEVVQQLDPQLPPLHGDVGAIKQVALNLLTNAAEAMPSGGRLGVMTADNVNFGGELFVLLQISDTGAGVPAEVMQRLFKPGTTTKGDGHEGIGLAESASILQRLGGRILCRSSPGRGTIFLTLLPRRLYAASAPQEVPRPSASTP